MRKAIDDIQGGGQDCGRSAVRACNDIGKEGAMTFCIFFDWAVRRYVFTSFDLVLALAVLLHSTPVTKLNSLYGFSAHSLKVAFTSRPSVVCSI